MLGTPTAASSDIYVVGADGTDERPVTRHEGDDLAPAWSPDGTRVALVGQGEGTAHVFVVNADGTGQRRLTTAPGDVFAPTWSSDGSRVAFVSERDGSRQIYLV